MTKQTDVQSYLHLFHYLFMKWHLTLILIILVIKYKGYNKTLNDQKRDSKFLLL